MNPCAPAGLGRHRRLSRALRQGAPVVFLCADVGLQVGPPGTYGRVEDLDPLVRMGVDGVFLSLGTLRWFSTAFADDCELSLVVRTDWCSQWRPQELNPHADGRAVTITTPTQAAEAGADAIVQYMLMGSGDPDVERGYISRTAKCIRDAHQIGLPVIIEPLVRGSAVEGSERKPDFMRLAIRTAVELGADALKVEAPDESDFEAVIGSCPVPVLLASTAPIGDEPAIRRAALGRRAGAAGVAYSADFFGSRQPDHLLASLRRSMTGPPRSSSKEKVYA